MEAMFSKWIRETVNEIRKASENQNLYRLYEMRVLKQALEDLRDTLIISMR